MWSMAFNMEFQKTKLLNFTTRFRNLVTLLYAWRQSVQLNLRFLKCQVWFFKLLLFFEFYVLWTLWPTLFDIEVIRSLTEQVVAQPVNTLLSYAASCLVHPVVFIFLIPNLIVFFFVCSEADQVGKEILCEYFQIFVKIILI